MARDFIVSRALVRKVRKLLGPKLWQMCSVKKLRAVERGRGWKGFFMGCVDCGCARTWDEALEKLFISVSYMRRLKEGKGA